MEKCPLTGREVSAADCYKCENGEEKDASYMVCKLEQDTALATQSNLLFDKQEFDFSGALRLLKDGNRMTRLGWTSPGMWIKLVPPTQHVNGDFVGMHKAHFLMYGKQKDFAVWFPSVCDILAEDWVIVT